MRREPVRGCCCRCSWAKNSVVIDLGSTWQLMWATDIELEAVLDQVVLPLSDVLNWEPGAKLQLNAVEIHD